MIEDGDRIAVGVSGGKDSLVLLRALAHLRTYYPCKFELEAITIELGYDNMDYSPIEKLCREIDVPYTCIKTDIREVVFDVRREENPCSLCSKMRRGALNDALKSRGMNKLALGHHMDDAIETFVMSLIFEGRISCFKPVTYMSRADVFQIRPMIYSDEKRIANLCEKLDLPVVKNACPADKDSKRRQIKELLASLEEDYPDIKSKIFGAMRRLPLEGWGIAGV
ncbi:MAG: tRNA 2-thiocytidine biosynthesis protein TtcA [Clostridiales bacterium]|nr:tRNA 2-thiocytidine biosynthesis protein TtcA [Clostridiales bacterium]